MALRDVHRGCGLCSCSRVQVQSGPGAVGSTGCSRVQVQSGPGAVGSRCSRVLFAFILHVLFVTAFGGAVRQIFTEIEGAKWSQHWHAECYCGSQQIFPVLMSEC